MFDVFEDSDNAPGEAELLPNVISPRGYAGLPLLSLRRPKHK